MLSAHELALAHLSVSDASVGDELRQLAELGFYQLDRRGADRLVLLTCALYARITDAR